MRALALAVLAPLLLAVAWPGEVGPIYVEGATVNDVLVVKILRLRPNRDLAVARIHTAPR